MIPVLEVDEGVFEPLSGNPVVPSLDGSTEQPLRVILGPGWTADERAEFGVFLAKPFSLPPGMRKVGERSFKRVGGSVVETYDIVEIARPVT